MLQIRVSTLYNRSKQSAFMTRDEYQKFSTNTHLRLYLYSSSHFHDGFFYNIKAKAGPLRSFIYPVIHGENILQVLFLNALPVISKLYFCTLFCCMHTDL